MIFSDERDKARDIIAFWNETIVPITKCRKQSLVGTTIDAIVGSFGDIGPDEWISALSESKPLRGFYQHARVTLRRLANKDKTGARMIERLADGEWDSWTAPTRTDDEPWLDDIIRHGAVPTDWLYPPSGSELGVDEKTAALYCQCMYNHSRHLLAWLTVMHPGATKNTTLWKNMNGLLDPLLPGWSSEAV